jgi:radial spoke head protein 9
MDISDLDARLNLVKPAGICLNLQERMQLELALTELNNEVSCDELLFWGKIAGINDDYFIAMCVHYVGKYEFADKQFYYATVKNFKFAQIPEPLE